MTKKPLSHNPCQQIHDTLFLDEFGGVNPSINDSSTFAFHSPATMSEAFDHEMEGCFLYSRHWNPTNKKLALAMAELEGSEAAQVTSSGMAAIACAILQLCKSGDEVVSSRTIYGGTYALFKNFLPRLGIRVRFVDTGNLRAVARAMTPRTKVLYVESVSNPLLDVADVPALARMAKKRGAALVVDNTFAPLVLSPLRSGADAVVHSLTKFVNGASDCIAGAVCSSADFVHRLTDINSGACMLLGPVLDSVRAAGILKNIHTLHVRMQKHGVNALYLARRLEKLGLRVFYPGLPSHHDHRLMKRLMNPGFGFGGMLALDLGTGRRADAFMTRMQDAKVGYLAVSLGYSKTLFSVPGHSTSSEIPAAEQKRMGLGDGLVRMSVGLDHDVEETFRRIRKCLKNLPD
jgi:methionine-gamma-lyase